MSKHIHLNLESPVMVLLDPETVDLSKLDINEPGTASLTQNEEEESSSSEPTPTPKKIDMP